LGAHLIDDPESGKVEAGRLALALELFYGQALQRAGVVLLQNLFNLASAKAYFSTSRALLSD
jgi:hypothetical protein